jgi:hypothetical protein
VLRGQNQGVAVETNPLLAPWQRFDTIWYERIAEQGYRPHDGSTAFRPLYPLLIRLLSTVTGNSLLAALLIANLCFIALVALVHYLAWQHGGAAAARRATALYVLFPSAFFLLCGYSESLFILCCAAGLVAAQRRRWGWAGVAGALAALTRQHGGLMIIPLAILFVQAYGGRTRDHWRQAAWLLLPPLGTLAFPVYTALVVGAPFSPMAVQAQQWGHPVMWPWETVRDYVALIRAPAWHFINSPGGNYVELWDLTCIGLFGLLILLSARSLGAALTAYNLVQYTVGLTGLHSTSRFMLPLVPVFMVLGCWTVRRRLIFDVVLAISLALYLFFAAQFALDSWVA